MRKPFLSVRIDTFIRSNYQQLYLNDSPYHIDKLTRALKNHYTSEEEFMQYQVYKEGVLKHQGEILVNIHTDFRSLIHHLSRNNFNYIFSLRPNRIHY